MKAENGRTKNKTIKHYVGVLSYSYSYLNNDIKVKCSETGRKWNICHRSRDVLGAGDGADGGGAPMRSIAMVVYIQITRYLISSSHM